MSNLLKSIQIENFCGFSKPGRIDIPSSNGKIGSGLTIFVGENNSGKSSIFESIKKLKIGSKFLPKERHRNQSPNVIFTDKNDKTTIVRRINKAVAEIEKSGLIDSNIFEIINSRRHWQATFSSHSTQSYQQYLTNSNWLDSKSGNIDNHLGSLLEQISGNNDQNIKFNSILSRLIPSFIGWEIDTDNDGRDYVKYHISSKHSHDTSLVGDGVISLFRICAHLVSTNPDLVLCLDEPELSLSPRAQRILARELAIAAKEKQILVTTHCPHFVNWQDLINGAMLYRVMKNSKGECELFQLNTNSSSFTQLCKSTEDWQKPHVLDAVAKEFFFSEKILFLEGQEDVGLIRKFIYENVIPINFDIFGYGAGGSGNIPALLQLAKELGIKAGALFDKNAPGLDSARKKYSSDFKIEELKFDDIRVKEGTGKTGLFETNGSISDSNSQILNKILEGFVEYFK